MTWQKRVDNGKVNKLMLIMKNSVKIWKIHKAKNYLSLKNWLSQKKISKIRNLSRINTNQAKPIFLTYNTKVAMKNWWLAFIKAPILQHFNWKFYIQIEINISNFAIRKILNQLNFWINLNNLVTIITLSKW